MMKRSDWLTAFAVSVAAALPVLAGEIDRTVPVPAGSYVIHYGNKIHYDGAKNEDVVIQVWGMGPATSTPAEKR